MHTFDGLAVLLVEDDDYKLTALREALQEELPQALVLNAKSLNGAIRLLTRRHFDLAVVDMSLPTYELELDRQGGAPEGFAGEDILRFIEAECHATRMIVVTQLSEFSDGSTTKSLDELTSSLKQELGENYLGLIYYSGRHGAWRSALKSILQEFAR